MTKVGIRVKLIAVPESGERERNLTTPGLGEKERQCETRPVPTKVSESSQSPLKCSCAAGSTRQGCSNDHNDHKGCRSEAPPGDVVHHSDMVPEGEAQPDNPGQLVLLEVLESQ